MILQYMRAAMELAHYEIIDDPEPYYGEIAACKGVWATGKTLEECRRNLEEVLEGWIVVRLQRGLSIPPVGKLVIRLLENVEMGVAYAQADIHQVERPGQAVAGTGI